MEREYLAKRSLKSAVNMSNDKNKHNSNNDNNTANNLYSNNRISTTSCNIYYNNKNDTNNNDHHHLTDFLEDNRSAIPHIPTMPPINTMNNNINNNINNNNISTSSPFSTTVSDLQTKMSSNITTRTCFGVPDPSPHYNYNYNYDDYNSVQKTTLTCYNNNNDNDNFQLNHQQHQRQQTHNQKENTHSSVNLSHQRETTSGQNYALSLEQFQYQYQQHNNNNTNNYNDDNNNNDNNTTRDNSVLGPETEYDFHSCIQQRHEFTHHHHRHRHRYPVVQFHPQDLSKGLPCWYRVMLTMVLSIALFSQTASASCTKGTTELWAYANPGFEEFQDSYTKYITSSKGAVCRWIVISYKEDWTVKLQFHPFQIQQATKSKRGDCVEIYDGKNSKAPLLEKVCDGQPGVYRSKGKHLYVVYSRGEVHGDRKIGFEYKAVDTNSNANLIKIAGIVGGSLAACGVFYLLVRYTGCFSCLRKKDEDEDGDNNSVAGRHRGASNQERDRLTVQVMEDGGGRHRITTPGNRPPMSSLAANGSTTMLDVQTQDPTTTTTTTSAVTASNGPNHTVYVNTHNVDTRNDDDISGFDSAEGSIGRREGGGGRGREADDGNGSDSDSLHTLNEPPPSYESLYLNEDGEIQDPPPEYTPPRHRAKNPPRRVHTFN